jgi:hypothetical protein
MALGDLTKQVAEQAIRSAMAPKPATPSVESMGATMLAQIQAMQKALKEDEELAVWYRDQGDSIRVHEFFFPSWQVAVLTGADREKVVTRVVLPADALRLVCKVVKSPQPAAPARLKFVTPKPKPE